jgi:signal transduction histidine kinase/DNA-binding response OmpR family regulator
MSDVPAGSILVVDDEKRMCDSLKALLTSVGYEVDTSVDGNEASEKIATLDYDVILSDIRLPGKDGIVLLKEAKERDPSSVVILMTAYASLESAVEAVSEGAYDYLMKPVDFSLLKFAVRRAMDKKLSDRSREALVDELQHKNRLLKRRIAEINALYRAGKSLSTTAELPELLSQIINLATTVIGARTGSIMLIEKDRNNLSIQAAVGVDRQVIENTTLPLGSSIAGHVAQSGEPLIVEDIERDDRFKRAAKAHYRSRSLLCVPLRIKNEILGVINLTDKAGAESFSKEDLKLLTTFASQAAIALDDANHYEDAKRKMKQFAVLYEIASTIPDVETFDRVSSFIHHTIKEIIPLDLSIWLSWNHRSRKMQITFWEGWEKEAGESLLQKEIDFSSVDVSVGKERAVAVADFIRSNHPDGGKIVSLSSVPIYAQGMLYGLFCLGSLKKDAFTLDHEYISSIVASQATSVYERQRSILNATRLVTMGKMMSEISHDLRKPLTNIMGSLQVLKARLSENDEAADMIDIADKEIFRLTELVKELVNFSNPNKYQMEMRKVDEVVSHVIKLVANDAKRRGIEIESDVKIGLPPVSLNFNEMVEVLLNILMNAFDAIEQDGSICFKISRFRDESESKDYVRTEIRDTGVGIEPEEIDKIFVRYHTTKETGTGLGLAVVERIIMAHNGKVSVASTLGKGTSFYVDLPI